MLILSVTQVFFSEKFNNLILKYNDIRGFEKYSFNENKYVISFPEEWVVTKNKDQYLDMFCFSNNNSLTGSLYVLDRNDDFEKFIYKDSENQSLYYDNLNITSYFDKNNKGYLSTYNTKIRGGNSYINRCYYIEMENGKIIKVLFNVKDECYKEDIEKVCDRIIESVEIA